MNTNKIIWTDICIYEYKYYHTQNKINIYVYEYKSYESMQMYVHMCNNTQFMVLGLKYKKKSWFDFLLLTYTNTRVEATPHKKHE